MRLARTEDVSTLQDVYAEAATHGNSVGSIDWPARFEATYLGMFVAKKELYCFEESHAIVASVRLSEEPDPDVWKNGAENFLYVGKLGTANAIRGLDYVPRVVMPAAEKEATARSKRGLRLNCLGDNNRLIKLYYDMGFTYIDTISIFSSFISRQIITAKFEKMLD